MNIFVNREGKQKWKMWGKHYNEGSKKIWEYRNRLK